MSEILIQEGIQDVIQAMDEFSNADVVINDYAPFDFSSLEAPYVIIENSDEMESTQDGFSPNTTWNIQIILIERFIDWETTQNNFRTRRQAIIDEFNSEGNARSAGGLEATNIKSIRTGTPVLEWYDPMLAENQRTNALPVFLFQRLILVTEEF
jgi:hypothetical protein